MMPTGVYSRKIAPVSDRLWSKVDKAGSIPTHRPDLGPCWIWNGWRQPNGYGVLMVVSQPRKRPFQAHRIAWELTNGPIPVGLTLDHLCRVKACVNPNHLEPVTLAENIQRAYGWWTSCARGHEYNAVNTYYRGGKRHCRVCARLTDHRRRHAA